MKLLLQSENGAVILLPLLWVIMALSSCGGEKPKSQDSLLLRLSTRTNENIQSPPEHYPILQAVPSLSRKPVNLSEILSELNNLQNKGEVPDDAFETVKSALLQAISEISETSSQENIGQVSKPIATPGRSTRQLSEVDPTTPQDISILDNGDGSFTVAFTYTNQGDYNLDGIVDVSDLLPIAENLFRQADTEEGFSDKRLAVIDGNQDRVIDVADVWPIAKNIFNQVLGYIVFGANPTEEGIPGDYTEITRVNVFGEERLELLAELIERHLGNASAQTEVDALLDIDGNGIVDLSDAMRFASGMNFFKIVIPLSPNSYDFIAVAPFGSEDRIYSMTPPVVKANYPPVASLVADITEGIVPLTVTFDSSASYDPDGLITKYEWDFDRDGVLDATFEPTENPEDNPIRTFTYDKIGTYRAKVWVTDDDGAIATHSVTIRVLKVPNQAPVAVVDAYPTSGRPPLSVTFDASGSYDPDGSIVWYRFDFEGDGGGVNWDVQDVEPIKSFTYLKVATYEASIQVLDNEGGTSTTTVTIVVLPAPNNPPVAVLHAEPTSGPAPLKVYFTSIGSYDPEGGKINYYWDFGDGTEKLGAPWEFHTYSLEGTYRAVLSVVDEKGGIDNESVTIEVTPGFVATILHPSGSTSPSYAYGVYDNYQVGTADGSPVLWQGSSDSMTPLPTSLSRSVAASIHGSQIVGYGLESSYRALYWPSLTSSPVNLHPSGYANSFAVSVFEDEQVGYGLKIVNQETMEVQTCAMLWHGSADSLIELNPDAYVASKALDTMGGYQVGLGQLSTGQAHALVWNGSPESYVDLHPDGYDGSILKGIWTDGEELRAAGQAFIGGKQHALLFINRLATLIDLHPTGFATSDAVDLNSSTVVGSGRGASTNWYTHALAWFEDGSVLIDLHRYLPEGYAQSLASAVNEAGDIVGWAVTDAELAHAVLWKKQ